MEKVLEVKNISKLYKNNRGIKNINFEICKGDIFGFLGPNGAGKTTLIKIIAGLCKADQGEIKIFGFDNKDEFEKAMNKVGCLVETADANEYLTATKNLELAARFYDGIGKNRIEEVLGKVGLSNYKNEKVADFSLGMKQRLGLAGAILSRPQFVILDEPVNGLDVEGMVDVRNIILNLNKEENVTFFISSHLVHELEQVCNRIAIINEGELLKVGPIKDLVVDQNLSLEEFYLKQLKEAREAENNE